ncbi:hypothetical protein BCR41DRAFT_401006 [Lobosporangium transversale]|uniref:Tail specific protease domain-containing protein n=1 Tax=Lobosporangium transversale TaxID=64571 RepID=A0A1Y2G8Z4_9FUNG|nr:hypothetical protein BCR41DRAFT_401006 [Lobosporangium transversale]ORZ04543.1 hypothetical protein BCR41DRAFT_401006 [Lobosporangium transversale]|eukprot:XP_021876589.1 hypothetical protein BCR41DRAFT_401006 [Lobosporangium transversale]
MAGSHPSTNKKVTHQNHQEKLISLTSTPHIETVDYCAIAAKSSKEADGTIPYIVARGCYELFAFDPQIREDAINSIRANLESFYVFYDIAKSPPRMENSDLEPIDLSVSLAELANETYLNDYAFHDRLSNLIARLQDPHTVYKSMCYQQFVFVQPISTYGVYEDHRQQVKVASILDKLDPRLTSDLNDCEVTHIDGRSAYEMIVEFAKSKAYSKDRGVRINKSFSSLAHDKIGGYYDHYSMGTFAQRTSIPPNETIEYKIDCRSKFSLNTLPQNLSTLLATFKLSWTALDVTMLPFNDARSYHRQFCTQGSIQTVKKLVLNSALPDDFNSVKEDALGTYKKARELYRGAYASFYLLDDNITGIFRLGTESPHKEKVQSNFYANIDKGFEALSKAGARKLIVDLQNNSGGIICWGRYVLQTLFPQTVNSPYIYSLRASPLAQALAQATFIYDCESDSPYDGFVDPNTGEEFTNDSWMIPGTTMLGRQGNFSDKIADRRCSAVEDVKGDHENAMFAPSNITLLTNGFCGSTCAVLAIQMHERYGVRTVAIGGVHGQPMMFTSFPGGAVQANNTLWIKRIQDVIDILPDNLHTQQIKTLLPRQLPANGQLAFTFRQVLSTINPDQVLEYMRIPSEFRMDYTVARFRLPSILWKDVRDLVWDTIMSSKGKEEEKEKKGLEGDESFGGDLEGISEAIFSDQKIGTMVEVERTAADDLMMAILGLEGADREDFRWIHQFEMY